MLTQQHFFIRDPCFWFTHCGYRSLYKALPFEAAFDVTLATAPLDASKMVIKNSFLEDEADG